MCSRAKLFDIWVKPNEIWGGFPDKMELKNSPTSPWSHDLGWAVPDTMGYPIRHYRACKYGHTKGHFPPINNAKRFPMEDQVKDGQRTQKGAADKIVTEEQ